jgi:peptide/nickel transport system substrate-binding protein
MIRVQRIGLLLFCILPIVLTASAGDAQQAATPQRGGELRIAFPTTDAGDVRTLDPQVDGATYANTITGTIYESLLYQNPDDNSLVPGLAKRWEVSDDGKVYTLHLREDARFHDGNPVHAEAVKFTLDRAVDKTYRPGNSYPSTLMVSYDHSEVVGPYTIKIYLQKRQVNFLQSVLGRTYLGIVSPKAVAQAGGVPKFGQNPVGGGSGPYRFVEWVHGERITVERNPDWHWGASIFHQGPAYVDRLVFRFIPEPSTRLAALESGEVNAIVGVSEADQTRLEHDPRFAIIKIRKNGTPGRLDLNNEHSPTNQLAVRQAIALAINRRDIIRTAFFGVHEPAYGFVEEKMFGFNPKARLPESNPVRAREMLSTAGWIDSDGDGIREKDGTPLQLIGITWSEAPVLEAVQAQLKAVGIKLSIEQLPRAAHTERVQGSNRKSWHVSYGIPWGWTNEDPHILFTHYHSGNIPRSNESYVNIPEVDRLTERGIEESDPEQRQAIYGQVQEILAEHLVNVPLVSMYRNIAVRKGVHGIRPDVRGTYQYLHDVWLEKGVR